MKINHKLNVEGAFDTKGGQLICTTSDIYAETYLCFRANMHVPFAKIKLYSKDLFIDAKAVNEDAYRLGDEISKRWNMHDEILKILIENTEYIEKLITTGAIAYSKELSQAKLLIKQNENIIKKSTS